MVQDVAELQASQLLGQLVHTPLVLTNSFELQTLHSPPALMKFMLGAQVRQLLLLEQVLHVKSHE